MKTLIASFVCTLGLAVGTTLWAGDCCGGCGGQAAAKAPATAPATAPAKPVNHVCPVMGDAVDAAVTTVHEGKTIAFFCKQCIPKFKADPAKYLPNLK